MQEGIAGFNSWLADHLQHLRSNPGDDLMSQIIRASDEGPQLNDDELQALAGLVLAAGFETTVNLLGNGIRMLLDAPQHLETLAARPELWPNAVEEILRLESPVQMSARIACKDVEVAGKRIGKDELVIIHFAGPTATPTSSPIRWIRHRTRQRGQAPVLLRRQALLSGCGASPCRRGGRPADVLRPLSRCPPGRSGQQARHQSVAGWSSLPVKLGTADDPAMSSRASRGHHLNGDKPCPGRCPRIRHA